MADVVFLAVNGTVLILRRRRPDLPRPFALPGAIRGIPILPVLGLASVTLMMAYLDPVAIAIGTVACGVGLAAGWLLRARS